MIKIDKIVIKIDKFQIFIEFMSLLTHYYETKQHNECFTSVASRKMLQLSISTCVISIYVTFPNHYRLVLIRSRSHSYFKVKVTILLCKVHVENTIN